MSDRQVLANSVDPHKTATLLKEQGPILRISTVCHSVGNIWAHYSILKPYYSNFRTITAIFFGCPNFFDFYGTFQNWAATWQNQQNECASSEDSDQPGHPPSLIRVFAASMKKPWFLSYPLSAQRRLWSDWADAKADLSLRWAHTCFVGFVMSRLILYKVKMLHLNSPCRAHTMFQNATSSPGLGHPSSISRSQGRANWSWKGVWTTRLLPQIHTL